MGKRAQQRRVRKANAAVTPTRNDGAVEVVAVYHPTGDGRWRAEVKRNGVTVAEVAARADLHDTFHGVLVVLEGRANRLDQAQQTLHGTADGGPFEFGHIATVAGWIACRDSVCTAVPVPNASVVPDWDAACDGAVMVTGTAPISWAPPHMRAAYEARQRAE